MQDENKVQQIRARAYQLWEENGRPHGRDHDHWLEAERQIGEAGALAGENGRLDEAAPAGKVRIAETPAKRPRRKATVPG